MKKIILILTIALTSVAASAQVETSIGFKGGLNSNKFTGDVTNSKWGNAPIMGGFFNLGLADMAQFQFEALYERSLGNFSTDSGSFRGKVGYLDIPLIFKLRIPATETIYPYLSIGQSVGYKIGDNSQQQNGVENSFIDATDNFTNFNLATLAGVGVDFESELVFFSVDARYVRGNINVSETENKIRTNGFSLTAGLGFKLTKRNR
jgi:hypothetical protein